jgi:dTDP-4-dehydrorhamnose reductase
MTGSPFQGSGSGIALVVGGDSLVGSAIQSHCHELGIPVEVSSRRRGAKASFFDLADPDFASLERMRCQFAFVCAAVTDMRACQNDPAVTRRINVANTVELMRRLADKQTHLVFFSTSQVFDGEAPSPAEDAATSPRNEYGAQKLAVEEAIARHDLPVAVLRVAKVFGNHPAGIFKTWFEALARGNPVRAATNMAFSPVIVGDVARAAGLLAGGRHRGVWHLGARDEMRYFDAAQLMAGMQQVPLALVTGEAVTEAEVPSIFRQRHTTLSSEKIARTLDMPLRRARDVLEGLFAGVPPAVRGHATPERR